jgi:tetratricopeptide (TPR) repeat protein
MMARQPLPMSPNYLAAARAVRDLHRLALAARDESPEADAIRDSSDSAWQALSEVEQKRIGGLSEDLYSISDPPAGGNGAMNPQAQARLNDAYEARQRGEWDRALELLRRWGKPLSPALVSYLRGAIWREAGDPETAVLFFEHAVSLEPHNERFFTDLLTALDAVACLESSSLSSRNVNLDLAAKIALNMVMRGIELAQAGHAKQALAALDEVVTRFHDRSESAIAELVVIALWNKGVQLRRMGRIEENLATCDSLISRFQDRPETSIASYVAMALLTKGVFLGRLGRREEAVAVFDTLVSKFENRPEVRITECVAGAVVNKGHELEVRITECVAGALVNKGHELGELGRGDEALTVFDTVVSRYWNRPEVDILAQVASALVTKGYRLGKLRRAEEELATYDMLELEFQGRTEAAIAEQVAKSLFNRAFRLGQLGRVMEELAIYDALALRFGERVEAGIAEWVAAARLNKAFHLWELGRDAEALEVYDAVIRLQYSPEPSVISERVASALYGKGVTLCRLGDLMNAHESLAQVITRYQGNDKPGVVEVLARATQALEWIRTQGETREPWNSSDSWTQPMMNVPRPMSAMDFAASI